MLSSDCGVYPVKKIFEYDDLALNTGNTQSQTMLSYLRFQATLHTSGDLLVLVKPP